MHLDKQLMGKQKSPRGISPGLFYFPVGKQKSPGEMKFKIEN